MQKQKNNNDDQKARRRAEEERIEATFKEFEQQFPAGANPITCLRDFGMELDLFTCPNCSKDKVELAENERHASCLDCNHKWWLTAKTFLEKTRLIREY